LNRLNSSQKLTNAADIALNYQTGAGQAMAGKTVRVKRSSFAASLVALFEKCLENSYHFPGNVNTPFLSGPLTRIDRSDVLLYLFPIVLHEPDWP
jgi:hypothetical protein